jgi:hypothetical protein
MSAWTNTDTNHKNLPKFPIERETREYAQLVIATGNTAGNTIITVTAYDGGPSTLANIGVASGQYVYFWSSPGTTTQNAGGQAGNGVPGMFFSNTTVSSVTGNTVILANPLFNTVSAGFVIEFDKAINYGNTIYANTYTKDTILVTASRSQNTQSGGPNVAAGILANTVGNINAGWVHIQKKVNSDGTVRYLKETLVCLANGVASNVSSGNTSFGPFLAGL